MLYIEYEPIPDQHGFPCDKQGRRICGQPIRNPHHPEQKRWCGVWEGLLGVQQVCRGHWDSVKTGIAASTLTQNGTAPAFENNVKDFILGPYWRNLAHKMRWGYKRNLEDPDSLTVEHELALLRERNADLLLRTEQGESGQLWKLLKETFTQFRTARGGGDAEIEQQSFDKLGTLINQGIEDYQAWDEIQKNKVMIHKLVESEQKRQLQEKLLAPAAQAVEVIKAMALAVRECVEDQTIRDAIQRRHDAILAARIARRERHTVLLDKSRGDIIEGEVSGSEA